MTRRGYLLPCLQTGLLTGYRDCQCAVCATGSPWVPWVPGPGLLLGYIIPWSRCSETWKGKGRNHVDCKSQNGRMYRTFKSTCHSGRRISSGTDRRILEDSNFKFTFAPRYCFHPNVVCTLTFQSDIYDEMAFIACFKLVMLHYQKYKMAVHITHKGEHIYILSLTHTYTMKTHRTHTYNPMYIYRDASRVCP